MIIFDLANEKAENIKSEIYNLLVTCQMCDLEDVSLFNPNCLHGF